jgi:anti-sigma factor RsiW
VSDTGQPLDHAAIEELLGAYALDAVEPDERDQIEAHLATCPRCRAEVAEHREVAALLGYGGAAAPEGVWGRIRESLEPAPPELRLAVTPSEPATPEPRQPLPEDAGAPVSDLDARRRRRSRLRIALVGAAAAVVIAVLGAEVLHLSNQVDRMREETALQVAATDAFGDPTAQQASLQTADGTVEARAVVTGSGEGYVLAGNLPDLSDGTYQLWGETDGTVVSLAVMGPAPDVVAFTAQAPLSRLMVTAEKAPVAQTSNTPVVIGTVT